MRDMLDRHWLSCQCPICKYELEFTFLQVRLEETILCPCCKSYIHLVDSDASAEGSRREVNNALAELKKLLK